MTNFPITNEEILAAVTETIEAHQGEVRRLQSHEYFMTLQAVLPVEEELFDGERLRQGVSIKTTWEEIQLVPFVLLKNGERGIAVPVGFSCVTVNRNEDRDSALLQIQKGVMSCFHPATIAEIIHQFRDANQRQISSGFDVFSLLKRNLPSLPANEVEHIRDEFAQEENSEYGLMNAITSVASRSEDSFLQWDLEMLAGQIGISEAQMPVLTPVISNPPVSITHA